MPPVKVTLRQGPLNQMLKSPGGDVARFMRGRLQAVEVAAKQRCPVDEGELRASSSIDIQAGAHGPEGSLTFAANHAIFVHEGTRPHFPPIAAVESWAKRHGFPNAYLVARAISIKGTKGTPFLWDALSAVMQRARRR